MGPDRHHLAYPTRYRPAGIALPIQSKPPAGSPSPNPDGIMTYPGGKHGAGVYQRIINQIPPHRVYIEGCVGGGAILKQKRPAAISYAIDIDPGAVGGLAGAVPDGTRLINADVIGWLEAYPFDGSEFVYLDPPYLLETRRSAEPIYRYEFTTEQHARLLDVITRVPSRVMISGYPSAMYAAALAEWRELRLTVPTRQGPAEEALWMNYPRPAVLHDYRFIGDDRRRRQDLARQRRRWARRFAALPPLQRSAILEVLRGIHAGEDLDGIDAAGPAP